MEVLELGDFLLHCYCALVGSPEVLYLDEAVGDGELAVVDAEAGLGLVLDVDSLDVAGGVEEDAELVDHI